MENTNTNTSLSFYYVCDPEKNTKCKKKHCYIYGGKCKYTVNHKCAKEETIDDKDQRSE